MSARSGRLSRDTLVYGIGGSAAQIINVAFIPVFTRIFTPAQFGALDFLLTLNAIGVLIAQAGINSAVFYYYRRHDDTAERRAMTATALVVVGTLGAALAILGAIFAAPISRAVLLSDAYAVAVGLAFVWIPVNVIGTLALDLLRLEFRPAAYSVLGFGRTLLASAVGAVLAGPFGWGVAGMLASYVLIGLAGALVTIWLARSSLRRSYDSDAARRLLRFGLPLIPTGLAYWIIAYSDRYLIIQILGIADAGIYSLANRVSMGVQLVLYAFEAAWWPFAYARAREPDHRQLFSRIFTTFWFGMTALLVLLGLFAREILLVLSTPAFLPAYPYVGILALALVVHGAYGIISIGVQLGQRTVHMAWTSGLAAAVNIGLNLVLIPWIGILGAAIATLVAYAVSTALLFVVAQRAYPIPYRLRGAALAVAVGAGMLGAGLVLDAQATEASWALGVTAAKLALVAFGVLSISLAMHLTPQRALAELRRAIGLA
jgi:O-antigen/teichoic acid export membrane protein